ncbi:UNVERIFIED_CONTAM: hypothetical protein DV101_05240 [Bifidobacterium animalis]|uniref:Uncharacterized protein n=1 Tax=Bifidobacterium bifidum TaxID=1681 RepID=A0A7J5TLR3_BIFBI|nr:hypothetical protein W7Y_0098 [Bifidobacterium animalis subsp. lactis B420]AFJ17417.1 hypothetical protein W91_0098 [Bifidobacterium animalis subsp. lactis Bi-07]AJD33209.1 hypothetical protein BAA6_0096 [Bifidobacterium animalis]AXQ17398.1 hypothetical protein D0Y52_00505 [Bifidobacterium animalis subsp. lactis]KAB7486068.1 hypothetical protein GBA83_09460 [Bifidobacterium bifidum]PIN32243.1 hypothetical protein CUC13_02840 [Bifidobacterium animalis subsp. lactis BB-12]CDL72288.1 hypothet
MICLNPGNLRDKSSTQCRVCHASPPLSETNLTLFALVCLPSPSPSEINQVRDSSQIRECGLIYSRDSRF